MTEPRVNKTRMKLRTPRAAAIAGILFALLYATSLVLIRISIPVDMAADPAWLDKYSRIVTLGLNLVPYAGIAFLWFIGVIRDHLGEQEDRLFSTVFLGSGLLFLALIFIGAAMTGGILSTYIVEKEQIIETGLYTYNRAVIYNIINIYAIRMAGVFMISISTIWFRTGSMHRGWSFLTYALALMLLLSIQNFQWISLVFPAWVFAVSVFILIQNLRHQPVAALNDF
jgi:hypothetical protein